MLIARRLVVHSAEDVGLADPRALQMTTAAMYALEKIGYPEAMIPLSEAIIYVCEAEKSNSVVTALNELTEDDLVLILTEPKNALVKQYQKMFAFEDSELVFEPEALRAIAKEAVTRGTGARGLRSIVESVMMDAMYEIPSKKVKKFVVSLDYAKAQLEKSNLNRMEEAS